MYIARSCVCFFFFFSYVCVVFYVFRVIAAAMVIGKTKFIKSLWFIIRALETKNNVPKTVLPSDFTSDRI